MTEEITQENINSEVKTLEISITLPTPLKMVHWSCYKTAKDLFYTNERKEDRVPDEFTAKLHGAIALIRNRYVTVKGLDELTNIEANAHLDLALAGIAIDYVAIPVESEINNSFLLWASRQSVTKVTLNGTPILER